MVKNLKLVRVDLYLASAEAEILVHINFEDIAHTIMDIEAVIIMTIHAIGASG